MGNRTMEEALDILCIAESELIPSINYTLTCNDKILYLTEDDFEFNFNTVEQLNKAYEYSEYMRRLLTQEGRTDLRESEAKDFPIDCVFVDSSINDVCSETAKKVNVKMQNAHATAIDVTQSEVSKMFTFAEGIVGYDLNVEDLNTQISTLIANKVFSADIIGKMTVIEPDDSIEDLKKNLVLISSYQTYSSNDWAGNSNMDVAFKSMNGSIIRDGEIFSFNEKTGNSNLAENGYYGAGVIVNGKSEVGIGGGICQSATTIYNAAVRAGMTIIERQPHTWPSVYVPVGIDAAIDYGNIDMKFKNDTGHEVYLICYMEGATLYAYLYGYEPDNFDEITISTWFTGGSGAGFGAAACRNYIKDGKVVKTEDLPSSFYSNGGGTSYAFDEPQSDYKFKHVFTDKKADEQTEGQGDGTTVTE
ncbi:MAG: VanW family protein [Lachnospiraceae bacterium]|nr:VanW family protein [Lachnospiraceae bacterium]